MKNKLFLAIVFIVAIIEFSCGMKGIKVPEEKINYIGNWKSSEITLSISEGGRVEYEKKTNGSSKTISAPIQKFEGDNFVVGALGINTTFVVSQPPHQDSLGIWKMTVDGIELSK